MADMITLTTDFGSAYAAAVKGSILRRTDARLVDVSHDLAAHDVTAGAFWARELLSGFPPAVHLVVVDPTVGSDRRAVVASAGNHALVGPDNGVLAPAARALAGDDSIEWYAAGDRPFDEKSFDARDVFGPLAAIVYEHWDEGGETMDRGATMDDIGTMDEIDEVNGITTIDGLSAIDDPVDRSLPVADVDGDTASGLILAVDDFGNCITNVPASFLTGASTIDVDGTEIPAERSFAAVDPGRPVAIAGSFGTVELAVNGGRASSWFALDPGDALTLRR